MRRDPSKVIKAGKSVELRLSPENYKILNRYLEQTGFPKSIKRVELEMKEVGFEDGSMLYQWNSLPSRSGLSQRSHKENSGTLAIGCSSPTHKERAT